MQHIAIIRMKENGETFKWWLSPRSYMAEWFVKRFIETFGFTSEKGYSVVIIENENYIEEIPPEEFNINF